MYGSRLKPDTVPFRSIVFLWRTKGDKWTSLLVDVTKVPWQSLNLLSYSNLLPSPCPWDNLREPLGKLFRPCLSTCVCTYTCDWISYHWDLAWWNTFRPEKDLLLIVTCHVSLKFIWQRSFIRSHKRIDLILKNNSLRYGPYTMSNLWSFLIILLYLKSTDDLVYCGEKLTPV